MISRKPSADIRPGDTIEFLGQPHVVAIVEPYTGPFDFLFGIARAADGWGISLDRTGTTSVYVA